MLTAHRGRQFLYLVPSVLLLAGCVRQTLVVRSNPPGARVFVNGALAGQTPVTTNFMWYANYDIHVEREGYLPVDERQAVRAPWYMWIPVDLFSEALPLRIADERAFSYDLIAAADGVGPPLWPTPEVAGASTPTATEAGTDISRGRSPTGVPEARAEGATKAVPPSHAPVPPQQTSDAPAASSAAPSEAAASAAPASASEFRARLPLTLAGDAPSSSVAPTTTTQESSRP